MMSPHRLLKRLLGRALEDERGAVTADWVVLTALAVGLSATLITILKDPVDGAATSIAEKIGNTP